MYRKGIEERVLFILVNLGFRGNVVIFFLIGVRVSWSFLCLRVFNRFSWVIVVWMWFKEIEIYKGVRNSKIEEILVSLVVGEVFDNFILNYSKDFNYYGFYDIFFKVVNDIIVFSL